ncbi:MAG: hypothetical protein ACJ8DJ_15330 [Gemmatimonadales bacterium]
MAESTPAAIDRAALERIIQRAAELQTSERDIGESLTPDDVLSLGKEVGIPSRYLQQALLEERTRLAGVAPTGLIERAVGPAAIVAQRVVRGETQAVEQALIRWMEERELFCIQRHQPGRITWEPIGGFHAAFRRSTGGFTGRRGPIVLAKAEAVSATVLALETGYTHVALTATAKKVRTESVAGSAALVGGGVVTSGLLLAMGAFALPALIPVPVGLGLGYMTLRRYGPVASRIQLGLERALDNLEQGPGGRVRLPPRPPGLIDLLADEVRKALKS